MVEVHLKETFWRLTEFLFACTQREIRVPSMFGPFFSLLDCSAHFLRGPSKWAFGWLSRLSYTNRKLPGGVGPEFSGIQQHAQSGGGCFQR